jgi:hypothetical protein
MCLLIVHHDISRTPVTAGIRHLLLHLLDPAAVGRARAAAVASSHLY